jgi:hypothetical protein
MVLTLDYQTLRKAQRQQIVDLLDRLSSISAALREIHQQKKLLLAQRQLLFEQRGILVVCQTFPKEESALLQEYRVILAELAFLREQSY